MNPIYEKREALGIKNYVRKARRYWFDIYERKLRKYTDEYGDNFNIILFGSEKMDGDFYVLPFADCKHMFDAKNIDSSHRRWIGHVRHHDLYVAGYPTNADVSAYYGQERLLRRRPSRNRDEEMDYEIENKKAEIEVRQKQSKFRKLVLKNFGNKCCLTRIREDNLLVASHIIPWRDKTKTRLDPRNGLCLLALYDKLFDKGYFTLSREMAVVITSKAHTLSPELQELLYALSGRRMALPRKHKIKQAYIEYHRKNIFMQ